MIFRPHPRGGRSYDVSLDKAAGRAMRLRLHWPLPAGSVFVRFGRITPAVIHKGPALGHGHDHGRTLLAVAATFTGFLLADAVGLGKADNVDCCIIERCGK